MPDRILDEPGLANLRALFAKQMLACAGVSDDRLERAFAAVRREDFLGTQAWSVRGFFGQWCTLPSNDPAYIYQDLVVALDPARAVNNGSPGLHAWLLHHLGVREGDHVAHIGAGTGYYTAILSELVGPSGRITAVEFDQTLADAARLNLSGLANVTVIRDDGMRRPTEPVDRVYVNFGVAEPATPWLDMLGPGGMLLFMLGAWAPSKQASRPKSAARGAALLVTKAPRGFEARSLGPAYFVCAEGAHADSEEANDRLFRAFKREGLEFVRSLRWREPTDPNRCWLWSPHWSLSYDPPN